MNYVDYMPSAGGQATKVGTIPFPAKSLWGGSDASRVRERTKELSTWIAAVLALCVYTIRNARIKNVGKYQSCMVSKVLIM